MFHRTNTKGVNKWVTDIGGVKDYFATDIRQAQAITVAADTSHDAR